MSCVRYVTMCSNMKARWSDLAALAGADEVRLAASMVVPFTSLSPRPIAGLRAHCRNGSWRQNSYA